MTTKNRSKTSRKAKKSTVAVKRPTAKRRKTRQEMRITIAKDVLAQLDAKKIVATPGTWVDDSNLGSLSDYVYEETADSDAPIDACEFTEGITKCRCCALGSIFISLTKVSRVLLSGSLHAEDVFDHLPSSPLTRYFSVKQLELIEQAFEGLEGAYIADGFQNEEDCMTFYYTYPNAKKRLQAIMKNIVKNKGTFVPSKDINPRSPASLAAKKALGRYWNGEDTYVYR